MQKLSRTYSLIWFISIFAGHEFTVLQCYQLQTKAFPEISIIMSSMAMLRSLSGIEMALLCNHARVTLTIIIMNSYISLFCLNFWALFIFLGNGFLWN
jgi:hypothetical protein